MALSEQRRTQLDGIVQKMISNKESDSNIRFVVDDFKKIYEGEQAPQLKIEPKPDGLVASVVKSIAKPFLTFGQTAHNLSMATGKLLSGDVQGASAATNQSSNLPFFGQVDPVVKGNVSNIKQDVKNIVGTGLQIGSTIAPVGVGAKLAGKAAQFGVASAGMETGRQLSDGEKLDASKIATSAALGAALPVVGVGVSRLLSKVPKTAWSAILKQVPTAAAKNPKLTQQIADEGVVGATRGGMSKKFGNLIQQYEVALDDVLSNSSGKISGKKVSSYLDALEGTYKNIPGEDNAVSIIQKIKSELVEKGDLIPKEANQLKRDIYGLIAKSYGKGSLEIPAKIEAQKLAASGIKQEIEKLVPEAEDINAKQAIYIQAKKAIDKTIARQDGKGIAGTGIGGYDLGATSIGFMFGGPIGAVKFAAGKKIAESPLTLSVIAKGTNNLLNYFNTLSPTKKLLMYNALRVFGQEVKSK